ncbi:hypothetical protein HMPREF1550_01817 [Actinomyces sp. oral taxon 877 str. F0543]|nr:hypothetical protein HMPREF1550_01817 [Actinomyces sp. oral taxon 877 str. F0543]
MTGPGGRARARPVPSHWSRPGPAAPGPGRLARRAISAPGAERGQ